MSTHSRLPENTENHEQYLQYIARLDLSPKEKYELLHIVHAILMHFVDQAFGVQTDQITLRSVGKIGFDTPPGHVTIEHRPENQIPDVPSHGVEPDSDPVERSEP